MFNSPWRTISVGEVYETEGVILILSLLGSFDDQLRISRLIESGSVACQIFFHVVFEKIVGASVSPKIPAGICSIEACVLLESRIQRKRLHRGSILSAP